jgi:competence protein ComEC
MKLWKYIYGFLTLCILLIIICLTELPDNNLHIIACDVGQGDAILITYHDTQILTDGGPDSSVLNCLGRHMPFWDRNIELVISTHPDSDHSTGLTDVIEKYNVDKILINPIDPGTDIYRLLKNDVGSRGVGVINPVEGMNLRLDLIHLDILNPNRELVDKKFTVGDDTNVYSITYKLSFKNFSGLFTGDIPPSVSDRLATLSDVEGVDYIKVPHHGSANGLTDNLLKAAMPKVAVISVGKKNMWGFPAPAILAMLNNYNVKVFRTDQLGDVEISTDGNEYWLGK